MLWCGEQYPRCYLREFERVCGDELSVKLTMTCYPLVSLFNSVERSSSSVSERTSRL